MGRRSDPRRVLAAQLEGSRMRLVDLGYRRDLMPAELDRCIAETKQAIAEIEAKMQEIDQKCP